MAGFGATGSFKSCNRDLSHWLSRYCRSIICNSPPAVVVRPESWVVCH